MITTLSCINKYNIFKYFDTEELFILKSVNKILFTYINNALYDNIYIEKYILNDFNINPKEEIEINKCSNNYFLYILNECININLLKLKNELSLKFNKTLYNVILLNQININSNILIKILKQMYNIFKKSINNNNQINILIDNILLHYINKTQYMFINLIILCEIAFKKKILLKKKNIYGINHFSIKKIKNKQLSILLYNTFLFLLYIYYNNDNNKFSLNLNTYMSVINLKKCINEKFFQRYNCFDNLKINNRFLSKLLNENINILNSSFNQPENINDINIYMKCKNFNIYSCLFYNYNIKFIYPFIKLICKNKSKLSYYDYSLNNKNDKNIYLTDILYMFIQNLFKLNKNKNSTIKIKYDLIIKLDIIICEFLIFYKYYSEAIKYLKNCIKKYNNHIKNIIHFKYLLLFTHIENDNLEKFLNNIEFFKNVDIYKYTYNYYNLNLFLFRQLYLNNKFYDCIYYFNSINKINNSYNFLLKEISEISLYTGNYYFSIYLLNLYLFKNYSHDINSMIRLSLNYCDNNNFDKSLEILNELKSNYSYIFLSTKFNKSILINQCNYYSALLYIYIYYSKKNESYLNLAKKNYKILLNFKNLNIKYYKDFPFYYHSIGLYLLLNHEFKSSITYFEKILEMYPNCVIYKFIIQFIKSNVNNIFNKNVFNNILKENPYVFKFIKDKFIDFFDLKFDISIDNLFYKHLNLPKLLKFDKPQKLNFNNLDHSNHSNNSNEFLNNNYLYFFNFKFSI